MSVTVKQSSRYDGNDWWEWAVWIDAPPPQLAAIDHVVYTLHPTFAQPVRTVKTRENAFRLESSGWGEFEIYIEVVNADGTSQRLTHELSLEYPEEEELASLGEDMANVPGPKGASFGFERARAGEAPRAPDRSGERTPDEGPGSKPPAKVGLPAAQPAAVLAPQAAPGPRAMPAAATQRTVYLSGGASNTDFTRKLTVSLAGRGVRVTSADTVNPGMPWEDCYKLGIRNADAAVFVMSGKPTLFSKMEMEYAQGAGNAHVIPVLVGQNATMPTSLSGSTPVKVNSASEVEAAATQILAATLR